MQRNVKYMSIINDSCQKSFNLNLIKPQVTSNLQEM